MKPREHEVFWRLAEAGYANLLESYAVNGETMLGKATPAFLDKLRADERFACGIFYGLHRDVGEHLEDYRSHYNALGDGSVQIVIDTRTLAVYADVDQFSPYTDVVNIIGHLFGEVVPHALGRLFRRKKHGRQESVSQ